MLNQLSAWWFQQTKDIIPNHLISIPDPNAAIVHRVKPLEVEVIVHGYIKGVTTTALWYRYSLGERDIYGYTFPEGLKKNERLPEPIITPTTKGGATGHDERLTCAEVVEKGLLDAQTWDQVQTAALAIFKCGQAAAQKAGLILVDTKYDVEAAMFSGCPEAVELCLSGELIAASRVLDRCGQYEVGKLLRAAHHRLRGEAEEPARCFEEAGKFREAAELAKLSPEAERSAALFEKAGDFHQAAEQHAAAGDPLKAARALEAAFEYGAAIDAYRTAGDLDKALALLEKTGRFYEAGVLAAEKGEEDRAIRCFQQVSVREADYPDSCEALSRLFAERRVWELAVDKARDAIDAKGGDEAPLDALEGLAHLLERADRPTDALAVWENIRKRDFQYAGAGERVEGLRRLVSERTSARAALASHEVTAAAPTPKHESRYEVLGELGHGGMGVVLRARDKRLGRIVALKRLPENLKSNATAVQLFLREARAAAALSHPNIVTLLDADQLPDGTYYLTMELLEGYGLDSVVKKRGRLSVRDTLRIGVQIAKGLQFAHEKGIVHRDIKTANLFFTRDRTVNIMDFGLAKMTEEVRRAATVIAGTPYYMAPEQAAGEPVPPRKGGDKLADVVSLAVEPLPLELRQVLGAKHIVEVVAQWEDLEFLRRKQAGQSLAGSRNSAGPAQARSHGLDLSRAVDRLEKIGGLGVGLHQDAKAGPRHCDRRSFAVAPDKKVRRTQVTDRRRLVV